MIMIKSILSPRQVKKWPPTDFPFDASIRVYSLASVRKPLSVFATVKFWSLSRSTKEQIRPFHPSIPSVRPEFRVAFMPLPALLFSSYCAEISVDLTLQQHHVPGIGIPGKILVAQITDNLDLVLVVLLIGFIGHSEPFLSLVDWRGVSSEVHAVRVISTAAKPYLTSTQASRSVVLHFADIHPVGTVAHLTGGIDRCSLGVRVALEDQAAFWAFAYLLVKPLAPARNIATDIHANDGLIRQMLEYFKADHGTEYFEGANQPTIEADAVIQIPEMVDEAPPGYSG
ncbi:hypothetical protein DFH06DRAFT_1132126 [Mycena polygramma]|nr:hypothetical protein DFH06DRAFT_1132126 [Mycena polygramma]